MKISSCVPPLLLALSRGRWRRRTGAWRAALVAVLAALGGAAAAASSEQTDYTALLGRLAGDGSGATWSSTFFVVNSSPAGLDASWVQIRGDGTGAGDLLASLGFGGEGPSHHDHFPWRGFGEQGSWNGGPAHDYSLGDRHGHGRFHSVSPWTYARLLSYFWRLEHEPPVCQPVPEPGSAAVLIGALGAGLLVWRRRVKPRAG